MIQFYFPWIAFGVLSKFFYLVNSVALWSDFLLCVFIDERNNGLTFMLYEKLVFLEIISLLWLKNASFLGTFRQILVLRLKILLKICSLCCKEYCFKHNDPGILILDCSFKVVSLVDCNHDLAFLVS